MTFDEFIARLVVWLAFPANAAVCAVAFGYFFRYRRYSVLIIAISAGLGTAVSALLWAGNLFTPVPPRFINAMVVLDFMLWVIGICLLLREMAGFEKRAG